MLTFILLVFLLLIQRLNLFEMCLKLGLMKVVERGPCYHDWTNKDETDIEEAGPYRFWVYRDGVVQVCSEVELRLSEEIACAVVILQ
jgi:hypothetical protein